MKAKTSASRKFPRPPANVPLDAGDLPFFASVIAEFPRDQWSQHQLELAALMARAMADLQRDQALLRTEGTVLANDRGQPIINPRKSVVTAGLAGLLSLRRSLSLDLRPQRAAVEMEPTKRPVAPREVKGIDLRKALERLN